MCREAANPSASFATFDWFEIVGKALSAAQAMIKQRAPPAPLAPKRTQDWLECCFAGITCFYMLVDVHFAVVHCALFLQLCCVAHMVVAAAHAIPW
jgi:hypothetical protein